MTKLELSKTTVAHLTMPCPHLDVGLYAITPAMAKAILDGSNPRNRTISPGNAQAYKGDMRLDRWTINGEAIKFDHNGKLIDGQHRLTAIALLADDPETKDKAISVIVFRGIEADTQISMDGGRRRTFADQYNIGLPVDDKLGTKVSAALRSLALMAAGGIGKKLSTVQLADMSALHPHMVDSVKVIQKRLPDDKYDTAGLRVRPSVVTALHYITHYLKGVATKEQAAQCDDYIETLCTGQPKVAGDTLDPAYAWFMGWGRLLNTGKQVSEAHALAGTVYTWKMYRDGTKAPGKGFKPEQYAKDLQTDPLLTVEQAMGSTYALANAPKPVVVKPEAEVAAVAKAPEKAKGGSKAKAATTPAKKGASAAGRGSKAPKLASKDQLDAKSKEQKRTPAAAPVINVDNIPDDVSAKLAAQTRQLTPAEQAKALDKALAKKAAVGAGAAPAEGALTLGQ